MGDPAYCSNCGAKFEDAAARFCMECGQPIDEIAAPQEDAGVSVSVAVPNVRSSGVRSKPPIKSVIILLGVLVVLVIAGFAVKTLFFKGHAISSPVIFAGGQVFYINTNDDYQVYRMNPDGSDKAVFEETMTFDLTIDGDWLYGSGLELYMVRVDGTEKAVLDSAGVDELVAGDGWLFSLEGEDDEMGIYRRSLQGGDRQMLYAVQATNLIREGDFVYYRNVDDNYTLWRTQIDGSLHEKLADDQIDYTGLAVQDGWIYYTNESDGSCLYKVKTDGSSKSKLTDGYTSYVTVSGDWVYYSSGEDGGKLYRVRTDGSEPTKLNNVRSIYLSSDDESVYFAESDRGDRLSQIKMGFR